ncbi:hypothetical protein Goshw_019055 [Gossypium schwendimanii]|uniref:Aminotransferase-like plant mobile domain-containing protein n=1 Tax=Gossypium schwendimanii TaxID=34291 RepID=A0A7J9N7N0_GOSSC|nr:hypothetical protein [Gossypium schwendimanii]
MGWLRDTFPDSNDDSTEVERIRYARAYIFQIIGGYLMSDLSRNFVHLRWLLKLVDFRAAGEFRWGSAVLATLYRKMCGATRLNKVKIKVLPKSKRLACKSCIGQLCDRKDVPVKQCIMAI